MALGEAIQPFDLSNVDPVIINRQANLLHPKEWPPIPGWVRAQSEDLSDVSSDSSIRGRRNLHSQLDGAIKALADHEPRLRHITAVVRRKAIALRRRPTFVPAVDQHRRASSSLTVAQTTASRLKAVVDRFRLAVADASGHFFIRPSDPLDTAWDVGLPSERVVRQAMEPGSPYERVNHPSAPYSLARMI
ncbi:MAG: hypothetical protein JZU64_12080, partial [Rhodoferax sp.]|nr:hypothetical protein [Rhodoferax sp.]